MSGSVSDGGQRFGVSGSISGSIGVFHEVTINQSLGAQDSIFSGSSFTGHLLSGSTAEVHFLNADETQVAGVSGSNMTYNSVTGSEINTHRLQVDKSNVTVRIGGAEGTTLTYVTLSGNLAQAHLFDADIATINDLHVTGAAGSSVTSGSISGSAESFFHKVTSFSVSASHDGANKGQIEVHKLGGGDSIDQLVISRLDGNDVVAKEHIHNSVVKNDNNAHGGLVHNNGQLSVGWRRRIFSRSTKALINRTQPTQGSGSLYTTCSLGETQMVSGSEMIYFNGLLLTKDNGQDGGNPKDGDYKISYQSGAGVQKGTYRFVFYSGSTGRNSDGEFSVKRYGPVETYAAQLFGVQSTGSSNGEFYLFYLSGSDDNTPLPVSASLQFGSALSPGKKRHDIPVEAISSVTDWRDVVTNLYNAMNTELNTNAGVATVSLNSTSSINGTASIEITYTGELEGQIWVGDGARTNNGFNGEYNNTSNQSYLSPSLSPPIGQGYANIYDTSVRSGAETEIIVSGSTNIDGVRIFLSENLAMDSDDVVVIQYLSGSHQF